MIQLLSASKPFALLPTDSMLPDLGVVSSESEAARARLRAACADDGFGDGYAGIVGAGDGIVSGDGSSASGNGGADDDDGTDDRERSGTTARSSGT